ncbi:MAG: YciI family protein [Candidatus Eremiobacteraeota bacterium]|nr:YciI family protein [Candidatus Eremiobacteraeota bacterium]
MLFAVLGKATKDTEAGVLPTTEALEEMLAFSEGLARDGMLVAAHGLMASSKGARVRFDGDGWTVTDGPFAETKELVAGFMILRAKSLEEIVERVKTGPKIPGSEMEIRPIFGADDFGDAATPELRERKAAITEART